MHLAVDDGVCLCLCFLFVCVCAAALWTLCASNKHRPDDTGSFRDNRARSDRTNCINQFVRRITCKPGWHKCAHSIDCTRACISKPTRHHQRAHTHTWNKRTHILWLCGAWGGRVNWNLFMVVADTNWKWRLRCLCDVPLLSSSSNDKVNRMKYSNVYL